MLAQARFHNRMDSMLWLKYCNLKKLSSGLTMKKGAVGKTMAAL